MKKIAFFLSACCVLVACSPKPDNYRCVSEVNQKEVESLRISDGSAVFGFTTLKTQCHVSGNSITYSKSSEDCKKVGTDSPYINLVFDYVIFRAVYNETSSTGVYVQQIYNCTKL